MRPLLPATWRAPLKPESTPAPPERVFLGPIQANASIPRPPLHHQHPAGGDAGQERLRRSDLLTGTPQVRRFVDHELVVAHLVEGPSGYGCAGGMHPIDDEVIAGHGVLYLTDRRLEHNRRERRKRFTR